MARLARLLAVAAVATGLLAASPAATAWNDHGHMLAAVIAWDALSPTTRRQALVLLRAHPRFHEDFQRQRPASIGGSAAASRWYFAQAATWPDLVRRLPDRVRERYHHGRWHYINLPIFVSRREQNALGRRLPDNVESTPPARATDDMNAVQAFAYGRRVLADPRAPQRERGLWLAWLLHVGADLHQPLHTSAVFHRPAFDGSDRGGNRLLVDADTNLHALWDGALGRTRAWDAVTVHARALAADPELHAVANAGLALLEPMAWAREGNRMAATLVYAAPMREAILACRTPVESLPVTLPPGYETLMRAEAEQRIVSAGLRLAAVLTEALAAGQ